MDLKRKFEVYRLKQSIKSKVNKIKKFEKKDDFKGIVKLMESRQLDGYTDVLEQYEKSLVSIGPKCVPFFFEIIDQPDNKVFTYYEKNRLLEIAVKIGGILPDLLQRLPKWMDGGYSSGNIDVTIPIGGIGEYKDKSALPVLLQFLDLDVDYSQDILKAIQTIGVSGVTDSVLGFGLKLYLTDVSLFRYSEVYGFLDTIRSIREINSESLDLVVSMLKFDDSIRSDKIKNADFLILSNQFEKLDKLGDVGVSAVTKALKFQNEFEPFEYKGTYNSYWRIPNNEVRNDLVKALSYFNTDAVIEHLLSILNNNFNNYQIRKSALTILKDKTNGNTDWQKFEYIESIFLGGFNEPYCSEECYNKAGSEIFANFENKPTGKCGFCEDAVPLSSGNRDGSIVFPYKNKSFFICGYHVGEGRKFVNNIDECCICGKAFDRI